MKNKNLKAVATEIKPLGDIADHLYFAKSVLAVISDLDPEQPDAFEKGEVSHLALEGKIRLEKAIEMLNP